MAQIAMSSQLYIPRGFNPDSGKVFNAGLEFDEAQANGTGQTVRFTLHEVTSSEELSQVMNVSAAASYGAGWGVSAEASLSQSKSINSYYTYALIQVVVLNPPLVIRKPRFVEAARALLVEKGWEKFAEQYGWEYVEGIITGGSYFALLEVQTTSSSQQSDVKAKLSAYYGPFAASAEFENSLKEIQSSTTINVSVATSGGSGQVVATDLKGMLDTARSFPETAKTDSVPIYALLADYRDSVPLPSDAPDADSLPRQLQRDSLRDLGQAYQRWRDYRADVQFVLDHFLEFDDFKDLTQDDIADRRAGFVASLAAAGLEINALVKQAAICANDYRECAAYTPAAQMIQLPRIGGELMTIRDMEKRLTTIEEHVRHDATAGTLTLDAAWVQATGSLRFAGGQQIASTGRLHVAGPELLYLLTHDGVVVGREWGGSGDLTVQGRAVLAELSVAGHTITASGRLEVAGGDIFMVSNRHGAVVTREAGGSGDLRVEGLVGVAGQPPQPRTEGWGGGIHTWDIEVEGTGWSANGWESGPRDLAERFPALGDLEPGDVVRLDDTDDAVVRTTDSRDPRVCGVVSSRPGLLLGVEPNSTEREYPVALAGRVPCRITAENGPVRRGDLLTSSSTPGAAMRCDRRGPASGALLGKALQPWPAGVGTIDVFLALG